MTHISKHDVENFYLGDKRHHVVTVDIEAETNKDEYDKDTIETVHRLREAVREEAQAIQDEMDEE